ncbi:MAG: hypothetical protein SFY68_14835 [Candidatus Sumerlaeia bacterium]|nr:hypothetical protein [Candidatus Sumerlaeia bacterium]
MVRLILLCCALLTIVGCGKRIDVLQRIQEVQESGQYIFSFQFDSDGRFVNPEELDRAIRVSKSREAKGETIKRLILVSVGWGNSVNNSRISYRDLIDEYQNDRACKSRKSLNNYKEQELLNTVIFCINWPSDQKPFAAYVDSALPTPNLANAAGTLPDLILFPLTYWSRATAADRIGMTELKSVLANYIQSVKDPENKLEDCSHSEPAGDAAISIYMIGHSFGCRILGNLARTNYGGIKVPGRFVFTPSIKGAVFITPAADSFTIPSKPDYPLTVLYSRHDHINALAFPLANLVLNSYAYGFGIITSSHYVFRKSYRELTNGQRLLVELGALAFFPIYTVIATPINYVYGQGALLYRRGPIAWLGDTFASVPIAGTLVQILDRKIITRIYRQQNWGERFRGIFNFGAITDSVGSGVHTPQLNLNNPLTNGWRLKHSVQIEDFINCESVTNGVYYVNASSVIKHGYIIKSNNMDRFPGSFFLSWWDPVGAHTDYRHTQVFEVIDKIINQKY